jgi:hypothetical protein
MDILSGVRGLSRLKIILLRFMLGMKVAKTSAIATHFHYSKACVDGLLNFGPVLGTPQS